MKETTLNIHIDYVKSVELKTLAESLNSMSFLYKEFMENHNYHFDYDSKLYIEEIKKGSIDILLYAGQAISLLDTVKPLLEFGNYIFSLVQYLLGEQEAPPENVTKKTYKNINSFYDITAKDSFNSNTSINVGGNIYVTINNTQANAIQNKAKSIIENLQENQEIFEKVEMYWASANFIENKQDGKVVINSISNKPTNVIFDEAEKIKCTTNNLKYPNQNWQDFLYIVDVKVIYIDNRLTGYRILKVYNDVLPLSE